MRSDVVSKCFGSAAPEKIKIIGMVLVLPLQALRLVAVILQPSDPGIEATQYRLWPAFFVLLLGALLAPDALSFVDKYWNE
jgi:hypothetical protein